MLQKKTEKGRYGGRYGMFRFNVLGSEMKLLFHVALSVLSAVLLYFLGLGPNLLFLVSSGKRRIGRKMVLPDTQTASTNGKSCLP